MEKEVFEKLDAGDIVRHKEGYEGYIVHGNYLRGGLIVVRSLLIHNPDEWDLLYKANHQHR